MSIKCNGFITEMSTFVIDHNTPHVTVSYEEFVCNLIKDRGTLQANYDHMAMGAAGEVGEIIDAVKKFTCYGKELDRANLVEELGDIEFYLAGIRQLAGISRRECLEGNVSKLRKCYVHGYSDAAAQARADKNETPAPGLATEYPPDGNGLV